MGFAIQSYVSTDVRQVQGTTFVQLARGKDDYHYHLHTPRVKVTMSMDDLALRDKANKALRGVLYDGATRIGKF